MVAIILRLVITKIVHLFIIHDDFILIISMYGILNDTLCIC